MVALAYIIEAAFILAATFFLVSMGVKLLRDNDKKKNGG